MALTRSALPHAVAVTHCVASAPHSQLEGPDSSCRQAEACQFHRSDLPAWVDTFGLLPGSLWQPCDNGNCTVFICGQTCHIGHVVNSAHGKACVTKRATLTAGLVAAVVCLGTRRNK